MTLLQKIKRAFATAGMSLALWSATPDEPAHAQDMATYPDGVIGDVDPVARLAVLGTNAILQGTICGIVGATENRDGWRDMAQCMLGAAVQYTGMEIGMYDVPALPGFALRIVETGTSIIDNTLDGRGMLDRLHYEIGPLLIEADTRRPQINLYWRTIPIAGIVANAIEGFDIDIEQSLSNQMITFVRERPMDAGDPRNGLTSGNVMRLDRGSSPRLQGHERTHVYQYARFRLFQHAVPDILAVLERDLHLRIGEDLLFGLMTLPQMVCRAADGERCGRQWYNLIEIEAYTMQTATSP